MRRLEPGFTLTELAIVLIVVGLMLAPLLPSLSAQTDQRNYKETQQWLAEAREALIGYALTHAATNGKPYLPCPDTDDDGLENRSGSTCSSQEGKLPWSDLGVSRLDSWGNRIRYRVHKKFSDSAVGFTLDSSLTTPTLRICEESTCTKTVANAVPAVLLSHGKNSLGAFNGTTASSVDEQENANNDPDTNSVVKFVAHTPTPDFDDIVVWVPAPILQSRMLSAGRLP